MAEGNDKRIAARIETALEWPGLKVLVGGFVLCIALFALYRLSGEVSWAAVKQDIAATSTVALAASLLFTAISFSALAMYDVLAVRIVAPGKVPVRIAAFAGAAGYAVSNLVGFSWLTGSAVRSRIYSGLGLDVSALGGVIATTWFSFWLGTATLMGALLAFFPGRLSPALNVSSRAETLAGLAVLAATALLFVWLWRAPRHFELAGFRFRLPGPGQALVQTLTAMIDIVGAALTLCVLLPADVAQSFTLFFVAYVSAIALGVLSHAPGGIGVFEATIVAALGAGGRSDVLAALVLYRIVYYLVPFAVLCLASAVLWSRKAAVDSAAVGRLTAHVLHSLIPPVSAAIALFSGIMLVISGGLPGEASRLHLLRDLVPLPVVETSHLASSVAGVLLVILARGLFRRKRSAWLATVCLLAAGGVATLLRGLDWEEAAILCSSIVLLWLFRSAFYRATSESVLFVSRGWMFAGAIALACAVWVGLFAFSDVPYRNDLWWRFAWDGDAPRYLRASLVVAVVFFAVAANSLINTSWARLPAEPIPQRVYEIVSASRETDAFLCLTGDKRFLLSRDETAFIAYADGGSTLVARGDPVGPESACSELIWALQEKADRLGKRAAFYSVSPKFLPAFLDMGFAILKIGEVGRVPLTGFTLEGAQKKDFRQARNKAAREGYEFLVVEAALMAPLFPELRAISDAWLLSKHGSEKQFSVGWFDEAYLSKFDHAILRNRESGKIVAFANLLKGAEREELSLDLMRYDPGGPGFCMDALFAELMLWGCGQGFRWFSLGAAPFSGFDTHAAIPVWNRIGSLIFEHGEHFYNFEGLRSFKQKFGPVWTPNYLALPRGLDAPRVLVEINALVSGGIRKIL